MPGAEPRRHACAPLLAAALLACWGGSAAARGAPDLLDITAVSVEGATAEECAARVGRVVEQARTLSLATSPPFDVAEGLRSFFDQTLQLSGRGELSSTVQLSSVYVAGRGVGGAPVLRVISPFMRVEVSRPEGTPGEEPSRIAMAWLWLQRVAEGPGPDGGQPVQRPLLHRFDFAGELVTTYNAYGHAVAPCRLGGDGAWFGAVAVWTYLAP